VNVIKRPTLERFWRRHPETEQPLKAWFAAVRKASWSRMADVKALYPKASIIDSERVVFDVCGGNYRLVVAFKFSAMIAFIKFVGTHAEYDRIDAATVDRY
jgi:mRNA interferase HigB